MKKFLICVLIVTLSALCFVACDKKKAEDDKTDYEVKSEGIEFTIKEAVLTVGDIFNLDYSFVNPETTEKEVELSSDNQECVTIDENGKVTAVKTGEAIVKVKEKKTSNYAECKVIVGDIIVKGQDTSNEKMKTGDNTSSDNKDDSSVHIGGVNGETLFKTIKEGIEKSKEGNVVVVVSGSYGEDLTVSKAITIKGINNPSVKSINIGGVKAEIDNLLITDSQFPEGGKARITISSGGEVKIENCIITTTSNEDPSGGYGIYAEKGCSVEIKKNTLSNLRYGIFVNPTDKEVKIKENTLSNMVTGIGIDIRQENGELNYPTKGEITENKYNEVESKTQFLHYGEKYDGDFDFKDYETEKESEGGGQGLLD